ncbi:MAG: 23S rRNA (pseudouridine(1915)-N(3))-methyltransferase RlmH [Sodaliphilus sp.]|jgi:23S rRNA (pseudouridine1915-N3)-methyltransferase|nr:23S rRNA (pseudouridine(1915)-N(3))-methyltransferase RlmH [Bacteroidales bacterium]MDY2866659.1 23S rRNA (pseudouridine(1915)-N(3))-methyltransferase RlmH [Sodaliphilus sp.]MCI6902186.1 23S rRNA (pseudouridine(1915)-N(3))-methyltransferase RlmH [Bacteroidales bacterium]MCI7489547.1 23S rRNA (pseudouridine(1915)-N(3))-methyltransferase RlmH [Bacteroidales bacterium]MDD7018907.1 23S rRNA (pseudouridine(1915)-N(3))-methyltransferase RlmH [Bacteroidales bacterium]
MKIELAVIGKTSIGYLKQGIDEYIKRLKHYVPFEIKYIDDIKNTKNISEDQQKRTEGAKILSLLDKSDFVVLLDEHGKEYTSMQYSSYIQKRMLSGAKKVVFVIGGPYGFSQEVYDRANDKISFSKMTFNHEMIRLIFTEQLYRAYTIINHEPYHHE